MATTVEAFNRTLASARTTVAFRETVSLAIDSFCTSKGRFLLTMLGMVIGSASIILVVTVGLTGKQYALSTISGLGPNKVEMQYGGGNVMGPENVSTPDFMTREDLDAVVSQVPGIVASSPMLEDHEQVSIGGGRTKDVMLLGVSPQYKQIRNLKPLAGRFFDDEDAQQHAKVAVIAGPCCDGILASELFGSPRDSIGQTIAIHGIPFTVVGVYVESTFDAGQSEIGDGGVLIPYEVARYFTGTDKVKELFFQMENSNMVEPGAQQIMSVIQSRHRPTSVYKAETLTDVLSIMNKIANMLTVVLMLAAFITLVVSGVGIMNSMLANVQSRIKEIGIRKALGATKREIRMQFLTESIFLSLSGGLVGTLIGLALPLSLRLFSSIKIPVSAWSAVIALATSVLVGVAFGTLPAERAARLDPVATLKYE